MTRADQRSVRAGDGTRRRAFWGPRDEAIAREVREQRLEELAQVERRKLTAAAARVTAEATERAAHACGFRNEPVTAEAARVAAAARTDQEGPGRGCLANRPVGRPRRMDALVVVPVAPLEEGGAPADATRAKAHSNLISQGTGGIGRSRSVAALALTAVRVSFGICR